MELTSYLRGYPRYKNISKLWNKLKKSPKFLQRNIETFPIYLVIADIDL